MGDYEIAEVGAVEREEDAPSNWLMCDPTVDSILETIAEVLSEPLDNGEMPSGCYVTLDCFENGMYVAV